MSSMSPGTRVAAKQPSEICQKHLEDTETRDSVVLLLSIVKSCYGPNGYLKMVQNACGGHVTVTSASSRLFQVLSISKPVLKLIASAVQTHLRQFNDGGLFSSLLALLMIEKSLSVVDMNRILMCDILDYFEKFCVDSTTLENEKLMFELDFSDINMLLVLLRSIIGTKRGCSLNNAELDYLCKLVLETFLRTFRDKANGNNFSHVDIMTIEGAAPLKSCLKSGVLFERKQSERLGQNFVVKKFQFMESAKIRCCVADISLSGDSEEFLDIKFETETNDSFGNGVVLMIRKLCKQFISDDVGVVFCQKVIHPVIQQFLNHNGVLAIERLGLASTKALLELTGCTPVSSLVANPKSCHYGYIDAIDHVELFKKHFYHIKSSESLVSTVMLTGRNEESLAELQHVFRVGLDTLQTAVYQKEMVPGGGCYETSLAHVVRSHVLANEKLLMTKFSCSTSSLHMALQIFLQSLESIAISLDPSSRHFTDNVTGHHWTPKPNLYSDLDKRDTFVDCSCGMIQNDKIIDLKFKEVLPVGLQTIPQCDIETVGSTFSDFKVQPQRAKVIDPLRTKLHALHVAMSTAGMVLRVGNFISDTN